MSAELSARRTAAAAVLADFGRALGTIPPGAGHGMHYWALRLRDHLAQLLDGLDQDDERWSAPLETAGPFETERQAADAARHIYDSPHPAWRDGSHRLLEDACAAAGVALGTWDHRILLWLTTWEPATCAVIAGLITRAHRPELEEARGVLLSSYEKPAAILSQADAATAIDALEFAAEYRRYRASLTCQACAEHPAELCEDHATDLDRADEYDRLATQITEATR